MGHVWQGGKKSRNMHVQRNLSSQLSVQICIEDRNFILKFWTFKSYFFVKYLKSDINIKAAQEQTASDEHQL